MEEPMNEMELQDHEVAAEGAHGVSDEQSAEDELDVASEEFVRIDGRPLEQILEALLLASDEPLSVDRIESVLGDEAPPRAQIRAALKRLGSAFDVCSYELKETASGFRLQVGEPYARWVGRLREERPPRYSRALLETLALIAYRQPITRGEIEDVRGVAVSTQIIRTLEEREWVRVVGQKDVPGRPSLYATTKKFLDYFNLKSLSQLPTLEEVRDLESAAAALNPEATETVADAEADASAVNASVALPEDAEAAPDEASPEPAVTADDALLEEIPVPNVTH